VVAVVVGIVADDLDGAPGEVSQQPVIPIALIMLFPQDAVKYFRVDEDAAAQGGGGVHTSAVPGELDHGGHEGLHRGVVAQAVFHFDAVVGELAESLDANEGISGRCEHQQKQQLQGFEEK